MRIKVAAIVVLAFATCVLLLAPQALNYLIHDPTNETLLEKTGTLMAEYKIRFGEWPRSDSDLLARLNEDNRQAILGLEPEEKLRWRLVEASSGSALYEVRGERGVAGPEQRRVLADHEARVAVQYDDPFGRAPTTPAANESRGKPRL